MQCQVQVQSHSLSHFAHVTFAIFHFCVTIPEWKKYIMERAKRFFIKMKAKQFETNDRTLIKM